MCRLFIDINQGIQRNFITEGSTNKRIETRVNIDDLNTESVTNFLPGLHIFMIQFSRFYVVDGET